MDERWAALGEFVEQEMARRKVPGVALGIVDSATEHTAGFGVTSVDQPLAVDADTLFQIGSTTKTVTATAAMRLVEAGLLDLDVPVRTYLPGLRLADEDVAARVTLRHLFTHTGGWVGDFFEDFGRGDDALARMVDRMATLPQVTPLGQYWSYNNSAFFVAGRVLEVVKGKPYEQLVRELVLEPLGMSSTFFFAEECITHRVAVGHEAVWSEGPEQPAVARPWPVPRSAGPAGEIISTVYDQLRYARFHMGDGTGEGGRRVLAPQSLAAMQAPSVAADNGGAMGVAWMLRSAGGVRFVGHGGSTNGQQSAFQMAPDRGFAVTVLTNSARGGELHKAVLRWVYERYLDIVESEPQLLPASTAELAPYAGLYCAALQDVELQTREGGLIVQLVPKGGFPTSDTPPRPAPPPSPAALCGPDLLLVVEGPATGTRGEFFRDETGRIAWLRIGGRLHAKAG